MTARYEVRYEGYRSHVIMRASDGQPFVDIGQMFGAYDALRTARLLQMEDAEFDAKRLAARKDTK